MNMGPCRSQRRHHILESEGGSHISILQKTKQKRREPSSVPWAPQPAQNNAGDPVHLFWGQIPHPCQCASIPRAGLRPEGLLSARTPRSRKVLETHKASSGSAPPHRGCPPARTGYLHMSSALSEDLTDGSWRMCTRGPERCQRL